MIHDAILSRLGVSGKAGAVHPYPRTWFDPTGWLQIEYQRIEIHLADGGARIQGERMSFRDGKITEEKIETTAPAELYLEAVEQAQRQAQMMVEAMLMPWAALMASFLSRHHDR